MKLTETEIVWIKNLLEREAAELRVVGERVVGEDEMTNGATRSLALLMADNYQTLSERLAGLKKSREYKIICCRENQGGENLKEGEHQ